MRLDKAILIDDTPIVFGDFNVFIGGNGVGKTTLVSELYTSSTRFPRTRYFWVKSTEISSSNLMDDLKLLKKSFNSRWDTDGSKYYFSSAIKNIDGNTDLSDEFRLSEEEMVKLDTLPLGELLQHAKYRRPFIAFSNCESRLNLPSASGLTPYNQAPADFINVLYRTAELSETLRARITELFNYNFVILDHVGTQLEIGISQALPPTEQAGSSKQKHFEIVQKWRQKNFTPIAETGHGIRSMLRLLTSLLDPLNQIILIDEPEMHLYPAQKRWLGRQLVSLAATQKKQVFVVTHDPMVLQGILSVSHQTSIFRVDKPSGGSPTIKTCAFEKVDATHSKNQEQYLQGLFYQKTIVVEGASDRSFYEQMFETYPAVADKDLGLVTAGGVGNSSHVASLFTKIGMRPAFIYDLDVILGNRPLIKDIFAALGGVGNPISKIESALDSILARPEIQKLPTDKERLQALKAIIGYSKRAVFSKEWREQNAISVTEGIDSLAKVGIFLVPDGTLESWVPDFEDKVRFADQAPAVLRDNAALKVNFDKFARRVLAYLGIHIED